MTTKSAQNTSLEVKRFINAPRTRVYAAWTDPAQLKQWFGPATVETDNLIADVRPGGEFRWDLTNCDGKKMTIRASIARCNRGRGSFSRGNGKTTKTGKNVSV
jgi:uncharacterized protein YndB with AHSA1/START domain